MLLLHCEIIKNHALTPYCQYRDLQTFDFLCHSVWVSVPLRLGYSTPATTSVVTCLSLNRSLSKRKVLILPVVTPLMLNLHWPPSIFSCLWLLRVIQCSPQTDKWQVVHLFASSRAPLYLGLQSSPSHNPPLPPRQSFKIDGRVFRYQQA